jgi:cation transport ATPase
MSLFPNQTIKMNEATETEAENQNEEQQVALKNKLKQTNDTIVKEQQEKKTQEKKTQEKKTQEKQSYWSRFVTKAVLVVSLVATAALCFFYPSVAISVVIIAVAAAVCFPEKAGEVLKKITAQVAQVGFETTTKMVMNCLPERIQSFLRKIPYENYRNWLMKKFKMDPENPDDKQLMDMLIFYVVVIVIVCLFRRYIF